MSINPNPNNPLGCYVISKAEVFSHHILCHYSVQFDACHLYHLSRWKDSSLDITHLSFVKLSVSRGINTVNEVTDSHKWHTYNVKPRPVTQDTLFSQESSQYISVQNINLNWRQTTLSLSVITSKFGSHCHIWNYWYVNNMKLDMFLKWRSFTHRVSSVWAKMLPCGVQAEMSIPPQTGIYNFGSKWSGPFWRIRIPDERQFKYFCSSVRLYEYTTREGLNAYPWNLILVRFTKICRHILIWSKSIKNWDMLHKVLHVFLRAEVTGWGNPQPGDLPFINKSQRWGYEMWTPSQEIPGLSQMMKVEFGECSIIVTVCIHFLTCLTF
jgi:hypothetical protein